MLDLAIASVRPYARDIAVNVHYRADDVRQHLSGSGVHLSDETGRLLGSAGAVGHLHEWIDGRGVLIRNSDAYLTDDLSALVHGWDGVHPRVLGVERGGSSDFGSVQYVGACLLPADIAAALPDATASLYDLVWEPAWTSGALQIVPATGEAVDCGTPRDYLRANLLASGGDSVIGAGASVLGSIDEVVVWDGGYVGPDERLRMCIRAGRDVTVDAI